MMTDGKLVRKNLWRKPLRTTLLVISIFVAFLLFGGLGTFNWYFNYFEPPNAANRLITINKINFTQPLPMAYLDRIRRTEGVAAAAPMNWFGGYYQESTNQIQTFPTEPESFRAVYGDDIKMSEAQWEAFENDRTGIIIGRSLAQRFGFTVGERIPLHSDIFTNRVNGQQVWDFNVVGIYDGSQPAAYFNREYFRESATFGGDMVGWVAMKTQSARVNESVAQRIDAMFANSPAETRTQDETAFGRAFLAQMGDINFIITLVVGAAFAAILMVVGNTMMMAVRERTKEIGVMKTLGFSDGRIVRMVLGESMWLTGIGAVLGMGFAALFVFLVSQGAKDMFPGLQVPLVIIGMGAGIALLFGLITGLAPALSALNLKIVDALGRK